MVHYQPGGSWCSKNHFLSSIPFLNLLNFIQIQVKPHLSSKFAFDKLVPGSQKVGEFVFELVLFTTWEAGTSLIDNMNDNMHA